MILYWSVSILILVLMEGLLSFDNALVLAAMVKHVEKSKQKKALTYGIFGAYIFRILTLTIIGYVFEFPVIKIGGGLYLLWLSGKHFLGQEDDSNEVKTTHLDFWKTVLAIEIADMAFSVDSILAAYGVSSKLIILIIGGLLGITMMRFAAILFIKLIGIFPRLEDTAFLLVSIVGARLLLDVITNFNQGSEQIIVWVLMFCSLVFGFTRKLKKVSVQ